MSDAAKIKSDTTSITSSPAQHEEASISNRDDMTELLCGNFCLSDPLVYHLASKSITVRAVLYRSIRTIPIKPTA